MSSDISKMFREVVLLPEEHDWHRFLYGEDSGKITDCCMTRFTFGISSSPFLTSQVLRQLASDYEESYPRAAEVIRSAFYVDDCLTGSDTVEEAVELRQELNQLLSKACITLRKWRSNSSAYHS